jgi:hypothetical protein
MVPAVAHALELPGKMRLSKDAYFAVQRIYYPGFTIAGIAEPASVISTIMLLFFIPRGTSAFALALVALLGFMSMQAVYWIFIHSINRVWLRRETLSSAASGFFAAGRSRRQGEAMPGWMDLRNRWEYAHAARAILATFSSIALVIAIS